MLIRQHQLFHMYLHLGTMIVAVVVVVLRRLRYFRFHCYYLQPIQVLNDLVI